MYTIVILIENLLRCIRAIGLFGLRKKTRNPATPLLCERPYHFANSSPLGGWRLAVPRSNGSSLAGRLLEKEKSRVSRCWALLGELSRKPSFRIWHLGNLSPPRAMGSRWMSRLWWKFPLIQAC